MFTKIFTSSLLILIAVGGFFVNFEGNNKQLVFQTLNTYADYCTDNPGECNGMDVASDRAAANAGSSSSSSGPIKILTTEELPGGVCTCVSTVYDKENDNRDAKDIKNGMAAPTRVYCGDITTRKYECIVQPGLVGFQNIFATIIRYLVNIVLLLGVLAIAGLGVAWTWAGGDDAKAKTALKKWGINIIAGLIILFLFQYILRFLAPWIYV